MSRRLAARGQVSCCLAFSHIDIRPISSDGASTSHRCVSFFSRHSYPHTRDWRYSCYVPRQITHSCKPCCFIYYYRQISQHDSIGLGVIELLTHDSLHESIELARLHRHSSDSSRSQSLARTKPTSKDLPARSVIRSLVLMRGQAVMEVCGDHTGATDSNANQSSFHPVCFVAFSSGAIGIVLCRFQHKLD